MNIQIITNDTKKSSWENFEVNGLSMPKDFGMFDINIIDLAYEGIWCCDFRISDGINCIDDLLSLKKIIKYSKKPVVLILPQNNCLKYHKDIMGGDNSYINSTLIKDDLISLYHNVFNKLVDFTDISELIYENSKTNVCDESVESAFSFTSINTDYTINTSTIGGGKATTLSKNNLYITTLKVLDDSNILLDYLKEIKLFKDKPEPYPEWLESYQILDDKKQTELIEEHRVKIAELQKEIDSANERLEDNKKIKSILFTNGDQLVEQVFRILEKVLDCNLAGFIDEKNEDFLIQFQDVSFIGEIKGVTSNIKSENISQLDVHYQSYMDKLQESGAKENVKEILIMNPFRNKPLNERTEVHENQIKLAERNNCLIIETITLLYLFEKVMNKEISSSKAKDVFRDKNGLLSINDFD